MTTLKFVDTHNMVAFLAKPAESEGFKQIVDFLNAHTIKYALTINPTIYTSCIEQFWATVKAKTINGEFSEAATIASSLEAEQDSGNINKTQSKATPNEPSSPGTSSGGGHRLQETIGDTITQTRSENVSKLSNDLLLARGNTLRNGEDSLKLNELMELSTNLQTRVLDLEKTKTTQAEEIVSLKRRFKKLEQKKRSRTHRLKRLYKVGLTARVESSEDEESLGEDASKQGRINDINVDEDITLVNDQDDADVFDVNTLTGDEVLAEPELAIKDVNLSIDEVTLAQALAALKSAKVHEKGDDKGKGKMVEPEKPIKKKELIRLDEEIASKLQAKFDEEADHKLAQILQAQEQEELSDAEKATLFVQLLEKRRKHFAAKKSKREEEQTTNPSSTKKNHASELEHEVTRKQKVDDVQEIAEVDDDQEAAKIKELIEIVPDEEEVAIDVIPLATKPPTIVDWKIHKEGKNNYYQIIRADGSSKMYRVFSQMLKSFDRQDLEDLYKLVKSKYGSTRLVMT
ncbi:hypothetical protein Tco_0040649 [Tanacetum coccineum]